MNIDDLDSDCLSIILGFVELTKLIDCDDPSTLDNIAKCYICHAKKTKCYHLHEYEAVSIKFLKLTCKRWYGIINQRYKFISGPILNPNLFK